MADARSPAPRTAPRTRRRVLLALAAALLGLLLPGAGGAAWTTNLVELDNGTCGANLQVGSDKAASASATPSFFLRGDGGLSSYAMSIDGKPIGTFYSTGGAIVCVRALSALADGPHLLTGTELAPHAGWLVTPLSFTVDTVPPTPPSRPVLSAYKDSGLPGDGITRYRSVNLTGVASPNEAVQVYSNGITVIGGARADASGQWSATTVTLPDGGYTLAALTLDTAGNRSPLSTQTRLTIDSVAPATPPAPTLAEAVPSRPSVEGVAAQGATTIRVFSDGVQIGEAAPGRTRGWQLTLPTLTPGPHAIAVAAADAADNVSPLSTPLSITISTPPQPPPGGAPPPETDPRPTLPDPTQPQRKRTTPPPRPS